VDSDQCLPELLCSEEEITELLQTLDTSKASGPDDISTRKRLHLPLLPSFTQSSWMNENVLTYIVPILKSSHKVVASIYRPTLLLSIVSKIFEKHIYNIIFAHVETSCPLSPSQWGFLPRRSAGSALLTVTDEWHRILEQTVEVGAIFFDDMVPQASP